MIISLFFQELAVLFVNVVLASHPLLELVLGKTLAGTSMSVVKQKKPFVMREPKSVQTLLAPLFAYLCQDLNFIANLARRHLLIGPFSRFCKMLMFISCSVRRFLT